MDDLHAIPADKHEIARAALTAAFGAGALPRVAAVPGGASGAHVYQVNVAGRLYLLRLEGSGSLLRNPHQYACLSTAAAAGIAPPVRYLDADARVVIMDYVPSRPLTEHPGGPVSLVRALGALLTRLHETPAFPELRAYRNVIERLLVFGRSVFAPGVLDAHGAGVQRILDAYPWQAATRVSSHNDPNPRNILFDGERLWLIDWETAYLNDSFVDAAIVADHFATTPELEDALLAACFGAAPDATLRARLFLMRLLTRFYYAGLILSICAAGQGTEPATDLNAPSEAEFRDALATGTLKAGTREMMFVLGKMQLAKFLHGLEAPAFERALSMAREG